MIIFKTAADFQSFLAKQTAFPAKTGFVPTMGALHQGHLSLVAQSTSNQEITVASIFVNPTQFNDPADYKNYPVTIENDIILLEKAGCDILFLPSVEEVYPGGPVNPTHYNLGSLETLLEGFYRPGHFQGVCQVMDRLLHIVQPGHLYMGSKDYQQCMVIKKLIELTGIQTVFHLVPTVREEDGLAMSSRNMRLSPAERKQASAIFRQFGFIAERLGKTPVAQLAGQASQNLLDAGFSKVDYVSIADPGTLLPLEGVEAGQEVQVLVAAFLGNVRLIDNMQLSVAVSG